MIIKVCGMKDAGNIQDVACLGIDWIGMVFYPPSPRYIQMVATQAGIIPDRAQADVAKTDARLKRVGVFVDDMPQNIITRTVNYGLDLIQLHGNETPTLIRNLKATIGKDIRPGIRFIKAISITSAEDLKLCEQYEGAADYLLFDTSCACKGGCGQQFDWSILELYHGQLPFLLSGGIGPDDAERIMTLYRRQPRMAGIDLNSRFETAPGIKDVERLKTFIHQIRNYEHEQD